MNQFIKETKISSKVMVKTDGYLEGFSVINSIIQNKDLFHAAVINV